MPARAAVVLEPPAAWAAVPIPPPKIAESAGAVFTGYASLGSPAGDASVVGGCVATPVPGWVEDMRPAIEGRTIALAGAAGERISGAPIDARADGDGTFALRPASDLGGPPLGVARTFVGFEQGRVLSCFAVCASRAGAAGDAHRACEPSVRGARLEGSEAPPGPGLVLGGVTWAVHHPRPAAFGGAALVVGLAFVAVLTRWKPRTT